MTAAPRTRRPTAAKKRAASAKRELRGAAARPGTDPRRADVRNFIIAMSVELSELAYKNGFDSLAVIFDMAREVAESDLTASDEHLRRS